MTYTFSSGKFEVKVPPRSLSLSCEKVAITGNWTAYNTQQLASSQVIKLCLYKIRSMQCVISRSEWTQPYSHCMCKLISKCTGKTLTIYVSAIIICGCAQCSDNKCQCYYTWLCTVLWQLMLVLLYVSVHRRSAFTYSKIVIGKSNGIGQSFCVPKRCTLYQQILLHDCATFHMVSRSISRQKHGYVWVGTTL
jgi:hypothetical protein